MFCDRAFKRLAVGCLVVAVVLQTGCTASAIEPKAFSELPRIKEFANADATNRCLVFEVVNGHQSRVCVFGKLEKDQELTKLLPFLEDSESHRGADAMHGRIPEKLLVKASVVEPFAETDPFWLTDVTSKTDETLIAVRVAFSEKDRRFYLEYGWSH